MISDNPIPGVCSSVMEDIKIAINERRNLGGGQYDELLLVFVRSTVASANDGRGKVKGSKCLQQPNEATVRLLSPTSLYFFPFFLSLLFFL